MRLTLVQKKSRKQKQHGASLRGTIRRRAGHIVSSSGDRLHTLYRQEPSRRRVPFAPPFGAADSLWIKTLNSANCIARHVSAEELQRRACEVAGAIFRTGSKYHEARDKDMWALASRDWLVAAGSAGTKLCVVVCVRSECCAASGGRQRLGDASEVTLLLPRSLVPLLVVAASSLPSFRSSCRRLPPSSVGVLALFWFRGVSAYCHIPLLDAGCDISECAPRRSEIASYPIVEFSGVLHGGRSGSR